jgi:hypothetical protein
MYRRFGAFVLLVGALSPAVPQASLAQVADTPSSAAPRWETFASCAAAYLANWQNRRVAAHVKAGVERFIAMDKAGTLEGYIDKCQQIEEPN